MTIEGQPGYTIKNKGEGGGGGGGIYFDKVSHATDPFVECIPRIVSYLTTLHEPG